MGVSTGKTHVCVIGGQFLVGSDAYFLKVRRASGDGGWKVLFRYFLHSVVNESAKDVATCHDVKIVGLTSEEIYAEQKGLDPAMGVKSEVVMRVFHLYQ